MDLFTESVAAAILDPMFQNLPLIDNNWIKYHNTFQTRLDVIEAVIINEIEIEFNYNQSNEVAPVNSINTTPEENSNFILSLVQTFSDTSNNGSMALNTDLKSELQRF